MNFGTNGNFALESSEMNYISIEVSLKHSLLIPW